MKSLRPLLSWLLPLGLFLCIGLWVSRIPLEEVPPEGRADFVDNKRVPGRPRGEPENIRFGLAESQRRAIHRELASHVDEWWRTVGRRFPDDWSRHDDFANYFARHVRQKAKHWELSPSIVYLVYDEGIREGWEGPGGQRFPGNWAPLKPRTR